MCVPKKKVRASFSLRAPSRHPQLQNSITSTVRQCVVRSLCRLALFIFSFSLSHHAAPLRPLPRRCDRAGQFPPVPARPGPQLLVQQFSWAVQEQGRPVPMSVKRAGSEPTTIICQSASGLATSDVTSRSDVTSCVARTDVTRSDVMRDSDDKKRHDPFVASSLRKQEAVLKATAVRSPL